MNGWMDEVRKRLLREWPERELLPDGKGEAPLREAAVLIPLYVRDKELFTLLTRRTDAVEHHKGQISFPGGSREPSDANLWDTAVRETEEEIGLPRSAARLLGTLPRIVTVTDFEVSPFVAAIPYPFELKPHRHEVERILEVPVSYLMNPRVVEERSIRWKGRELRTPVYHYSGDAIWGATAFMLGDLLEALSSAGPPLPAA